MGLEAATFIDGLNASWPLGSDNRREGDDHIRLIKSTLKTTFGVEHDNASGKHKLSIGNTASRPGTPVTGQPHFNTETGIVEVWDGSAWAQFGGSFSVGALARNASTQALSGSTHTLVQISAAVYDSDSIVDTGNNVIQVGSDGLYLIYGGLTFTNASSNILFTIRTGTVLGSLTEPNGVAANDFNTTGSEDRAVTKAILNLSANDYIGLYARAEDNCTVQCTAFGVYRLRGQIT